jgi:gliding motility-associated protein GldL
MSTGESIFESKKFKNFMKFVYGWGGAVVIVGAMFKITHWPGATFMLVAGLSIEAIIFILSAFEPLHDEVDWTLVYPELATGEATNTKAVSTSGVANDLDNMLAEAKIGPELIESLGEGMKAISTQASSLNELGNAAVATNDYVNNLQSAANNVSVLSDTYEKASEALTGMTDTTDAGRSFGESLTQVSSKLSSLNDVYEMQLKGASEHLENTNKFNSGINELMTNLSDSVEDTKAYKENMASLSKNLTALNTVYGNMLSAMNYNK